MQRLVLTMTLEEKYLFDTLGFFVVKSLLSAEQVQQVNSAIDRRMSDFHQREGNLRNSTLGSSGRLDCGNFMSWPTSDAGDIFRSILCHSRLHDVINTLCGVGHRLDHSPILFSQPNGAEGFDLHGGAISSSGHYNFPISYHCHSNQIVCNLVNVAVQFSDSPKGSGGFVVIPGSHKSNFPSPSSPDVLQALADTYGYQPECKAGDAIVFAEAVLHGAAQRQAQHERRVALYRFGPATCAYARAYTLSQSYAFMPYLTPSQRAVVEPPYHEALDRLRPTEGGGVEIVIPNPRKEFKKDFDRTVFNQEYY